MIAYASRPYKPEYLSLRASQKSFSLPAHHPKKREKPVVSFGRDRAQTTQQAFPSGEGLSAAQRDF